MLGNPVQMGFHGVTEPPPFSGCFDPSSSIFLLRGSRCRDELSCCREGQEVYRRRREGDFHRAGEEKRALSHWKSSFTSIYTNKTQLDENLLLLLRIRSDKIFIVDFIVRKLRHLV